MIEYLDIGRQSKAIIDPDSRAEMALRLRRDRLQVLGERALEPELIVAGDGSLFGTIFAEAPFMLEIEQLRLAKQAGEINDEEFLQGLKEIGERLNDSHPL